MKFITTLLFIAFTSTTNANATSVNPILNDLPSCIDCGLDSGGADGVTTANILYDILAQGGASEEAFPTVIKIHVKNISCRNIDGKDYKNSCTAEDIKSKNQIKFKANHFINHLKEDAKGSVVEFTNNAGERVYVVSYLECSRNLLAPSQDDLDEDGYYNESLAYSCKTEVEF